MKLVHSEDDTKIRNIGDAVVYDVISSVDILIVASGPSVWLSIVIDEWNIE